MIDGSFVWFECSSLLGVWLPFSPPCGLRWIKSGPLETVSYFDTCSCPCNDGYPRAKVTKRSKQPIYTHLHVEQFIWRLPQKRDFLNKTRPPIHVNCERPKAMASLFRLLWCLYNNIYFIDFSWLMTSQKMYVYFRHGKFENYSPKMTEWLLNAIDDIDPQLRILEKKKNLE